MGWTLWSDVPIHRLHYYNIHAILCTWYFTSCCILHITLHTTNFTDSYHVHFIAWFWVRSVVHFWLHSIAHSQPAWLYPPNCSWWQIPSLLEIHSQVSSQDAPEYIPSTLPSTPPSTLSSTPPGMLPRPLLVALHSTMQACLALCSQLSTQDTLKHTAKYILKTLPVALHGKFTTCIPVRSKVWCQATLKHTPEHALKYTLSCTWWQTPSLVDYTLPSKLSRRSQAYSQTCSQMNSQLHLITCLWPTSLYAPKYTFNSQDALNLSWLYAPIYAPVCLTVRYAEMQTSGTGSLEAGGIGRAVVGWGHLVCGKWHVAGGGWAHGGWNYNVAWYPSLKLKLCVAIATRF